MCICLNTHTRIIISLLTGKLRKVRGDSGEGREKKTKMERFKIQQWQLLEMPRGEWEVTGFTEKMAIDNKGREKCSLHLEMKTSVKSHLYFNCPWEHYHRNGKEVAMRWARRQRHRPKAAPWDLSTSSGAGSQPSSTPGEAEAISYQRACFRHNRQ